MSHPDPLFDPDNSNEDDDMYNYDSHDDFYGESADYDDYNDDDDDEMDGDHDSAMTSAGWGTDEDYGYYGGDTPMYDDYYGGLDN
jgi:hypothetical protein